MIMMIMTANMYNSTERLRERFPISVCALRPDLVDRVSSGGEAEDRALCRDISVLAPIPILQRSILFLKLSRLA